VNVNAWGAAKVLVVPGDPDNSFLFQKLVNSIPADQTEGAPMPSGEAIMWQELPAPQIEAVRSWIAAGALDN
jgi:hypothetical protein